ncbi:MAG: hypothetical protein FWF06_06945 [Symbiobacteriaceae bacterium]|nr:hypothetical protein [Symbiobacteriaceae bacterium]
MKGEKVNADSFTKLVSNNVQDLKSLRIRGMEAKTLDQMTVGELIQLDPINQQKDFYFDFDQTAAVTIITVEFRPANDMIKIMESGRLSSALINNAIILDAKLK